ATIVLVLAAFAFWKIQSDANWIIHQTGYGEVATYYLPDSSEVTLNANSQLRYASDWDDTESRKVWLEGEAYFKVVKQPIPASSPASQTSLRKFLVSANELEIAVVGTQFNVYARQAKTEVVLEEGAVLVGLDNIEQRTSQTQMREPLRMQPGEKVTYQQQQLSQQTINPDVYTSWRSRRLVFDAVPLYEVAQKIEEAYGVKVEFADQELAQQIFTGTVPSTDLKILLEALTGIYHLQITRQGNQLIIKKSPMK
ncbi:MAG: FecR domain-containing protein, partial [Bacteroidota bacterium]